MNFAYVPIGVPTFDLACAQEQFDASVRFLEGYKKECMVDIPQEMLLSIDALDGFLASIHPDLVILQNLTFANAAYATEVLLRTDCPIVLWTLREPKGNGGRLRLNSLTGAFSAANAINAFPGKKFTYVFGSPDEKIVRDTIDAAIKAASVKKTLHSSNIAAVGYTPQGFGFGRALDSEITSAFGVRLISIEARELMEKAKGFASAETEKKALEGCTKGLEACPAANVDGYGKLQKAYDAFVKENHIDALASRCWPDYFTSYGTPVCSVLSMLNDHGVPTSCEGDVYGCLSMLVCGKMTGMPTFFGDPVALDEEENAITFWHCGMAAPSLARKDTGATLGVHPNRKIGPVMDFGCEAADNVTIFRIGRKPDGSFRFFIASGSALDKPKQYLGTSIVVKTKGNASDIIHKTVQDGWEPHYVVAYADIAQALEILGKFLGMEVCRL